MAVYESYLCGNYSRSGHAACSTHTIYLKSLVEVVLDDILVFAFVEKSWYAIDVPEHWRKRRMVYGKFYEESNPGFICEAAE